jgi:hypothetical protein
MRRIDSKFVEDRSREGVRVRISRFSSASVTRSSNSFGYDRASDTNNKKIEMIEKTLSAKPLAKMRERAFEGAFLGIALIAMAGWAYFIILLSVKFFFWLFG